MKNTQYTIQDLPKNIRIGIVVSVFHKELSARMLNECKKILDEHGVAYDVIEVPGAFEIPLTAKKMALAKKYDCIITLGAVIKGETYHFDFVVKECVRGCMNVMLETHVPVVFEVLATDTMELAEKRISKGKDGALCALQLISTLSTHNL
jgi:6,7-dimethyl-8-ribityllumazine synthase